METIPADDSRTDAASSAAGTGDWPVVPPVPTPTPPPATDLGPEPVIRATAPPGSDQPSTLTFTPVSARPGATVALRARRPQRPVVVPSTESLVWPARFAWITAVVVLLAFAAVTLPLWLALYRSVGAADTPVTHVLALGMMLLGALLSAAGAWVVVVEMRARVRMVDALGHAGAYEAPGPADASLTGLLRPFVQVPGQLGLLAVALCLFIAAAIISLD